MTRLLRPGRLVAVGDRVWAVDVVQPVAAVLDAATGDQVALVGWSAAPPGRWPRDRVVLPAADGRWVQQQPEGPLVLVGEDGVRAGRHVSDSVLGAVTAHGAWCAPRARRQVLSPVPDGPTPDHRTFAELYLAREDQVTRTVAVDAPVASVRSVEGALLVEVETGAWDTHHLGASTWELVPRTAWLRLEADADVPDRLSTAEHGCAAPPERPSDLGWRYGRLPRTGDDEEDRAPHARTGALDWFVGREGSSRNRAEPLTALAVEPGGPERWRRPLGPGHALTVAGTTDHLWVAVEQTGDAPYSPSGAVGVLRVDADDYAWFWQGRLRSLDAWWTDETGSVGPLSSGLSDPRVEVVGDWPATALHITFRWAQRPGVRLRRVVALYDELGRPQEPEYADVHLMEDLDTGNVPSAPAPGAELLDF